MKFFLYIHSRVNKGIKQGKYFSLAAAWNYLLSIICSVTIIILMPRCADSPERGG